MRRSVGMLASASCQAHTSARRPYYHGVAEWPPHDQHPCSRPRPTAAAHTTGARARRTRGQRGGMKAAPEGLMGLCRTAGTGLAIVYLQIGAAQARGRPSLRAQHARARPSLYEHRAASIRSKCW